MDLSSEKVSDIGEQGLLRKLQPFCPADIVGDDAAILAVVPDQSLVVTTDVLVDGVHFSDRTTTAEDVGWRAAAANLSDLAAMGASPLGITVGLSLGGEVPVSWVERLYQGLAECLQKYNTPIVGGDICHSPVITIGITAFGQVLPQSVIRRSTAWPGDMIIVTGFHGLSRAGLELLLNPESGKSLTEVERNLLIQAHQRPQPRLDIIPQLWEIISNPAHQSSAQSTLLSPSPLAGMDSSDGLADAVVQICRSSGVGAQIERSRITLAPALTKFVSPEQALQWALYGGEDFELVLCLPQQFAQALVTSLGNGAAIIGQITAVEEVKLVDSSGVYPQQVLTMTKGFQHF